MQEEKIRIGLICKRCGSFICEFDKIHQKSFIKCPNCSDLVDGTIKQCCPFCFGSTISIKKTILCTNVSCNCYTINLMSVRPVLYCREDPCASFRHEAGQLTYYLVRRRYRQGWFSKKLVADIIQYKLDQLFK